MDGLYRKRTAARGRLPPPAGRGGGEPTPARLALAFLYDLRCVLDCPPRVLYLDGGSALTAWFPGACYPCDDFLQDYGRVLSALSAHWPAVVYGGAGGAEVGEIRAAGEEWTRSDVSGRDFAALSDLCVQVDAGGDCAALAEAVSGLGGRSGCVALHRTRRAFFCAAWPGLEADGAQFLYTTLAGPAGPEQCLDCLTIGQKGELWTRYLEDGVSAMEFEWLMDAYRAGECRGLLEWELALRTVLPGSGVRVEQRGGFRVTGRDGRALRLGYEDAPAAGRLLLKLLFPAVPEAE